MSALQQVLLAESGNFTTWNPSDKNAGVSLSGGNLIVTKTSGPVAHSGVRSIASKSSGLWHVEMTPSGLQDVPGIAPAGASLSQFPGQGSGIGLISDGRVYLNGTNVDTISGWAANHVVAFEYNAGANTVRINPNNTAWYGPYALGAIGACFVFGDVLAIGDTMTLNTGKSPFAVTPTAGYSGWTA